MKSFHHREDCSLVEEVRVEAQDRNLLNETADLLSVDNYFTSFTPTFPLLVILIMQL